MVEEAKQLLEAELELEEHKLREQSAKVEGLKQVVQRLRLLNGGTGDHAEAVVQEPQFLDAGFLPKLRPRGKVQVRMRKGPRQGSKRPLVVQHNEWAMLSPREATISELLLEVGLRLWESGGFIMSAGLMLENLREAGWKTSSTQQHTMMSTYLDQLTKEGRLEKRRIHNRPIYLLKGRQYDLPEMAP